jgi:replication-associated recombination protein RarA
MKFKSELFFIGDKINKILNKNPISDLLLFSGPGTGKTTFCQHYIKWYEENIGGYTIVYESGEKFGVDDARKLVEYLELHEKALIVFDEGEVIEPKAQISLRSIITNPNYTFIICTNRISQLPPEFRDRFVNIDCNIPSDTDTCANLKDWMQKYSPELLEIVEKKEKMMFITVFHLNFFGSIRDLFRKIENRSFQRQHDKTNDFEFLQNIKDPIQIQKMAFDAWKREGKGKEGLKEIIETIFMMSQSDYKEPFLRYLLELRNEFIDEIPF